MISTTVHKADKKSKLLRSLIFFAAWMFIWQLASMLIGSELLLPGPFLVIKALFELVKTSKFWLSIGCTLLRVVVGFILGMLGGIVLGIASAKFAFVSDFLSPLRSLIKATPVTSFIILVLLYLSASIAPMFIAFLMVLPISWTNVQDGIEAAPRELIEAARVLRFSRIKTIRTVYIPSVRPNLISAATTGLGFAWKSCVAAEVIAYSRLSIGRAIYESKLYLEVAELFAWTAAIVLLSIGLEKLLLLFFRKNAAKRRYPSERSPNDDRA